ncbi:MAG: glycosyltransferase family 4 protein [Cytophagaceae bacterium]
MKIAFDAKRAFNNTTGLGNYSRYIINAFLALYPDNQYYYFNTGEGIDRQKVITETGNYKLVFPEGLVKKSFPALWRSSFIAGDLKKIKPDLYHGLSNELPGGMRKNGIPSVVTIHDLIFLRHPEWYLSIDRYIYKKKFLHACIEADLVVAVSEQTKADLIDFFKISEDKIMVHYQDCASTFHKNPSEELVAQVKARYNLPQNFVLSLCTMEPRKNQKLILKALKIMAPAKRPFVVIAGKPTEYTNELQKYIKKHKLETFARIIEYVPDNLLPALYYSASLFVYPSIFEGFGIPILEALNCGIPVITSKGSCFPEAGGEHSLYISPNSAEELAQAMEEVLLHPGKAATMSQEGKKHALRFRRENTMPSLMDSYKNLSK